MSKAGAARFLALFLLLLGAGPAAGQDADEEAILTGDAFRPALPFPKQLTLDIERLTGGPSITPMIGLDLSPASQTLSLKISPFGQADSGDSVTDEAVAMATSTVRDALADVRAVTGAIDEGIVQETICGPSDESEHVELYSGLGAVPKSFVDQNEPPTVQFQWREDIQAQLPDHHPGNVAGQRWCTGTYVGDNRVLTAAHCFKPGNGGVGWVTPFRQVGNQRVYAVPETIAPLFVAHYKYQLDGQTLEIRTPVSFPVVRLLEYGFERNQGLDYALVELGANEQGQTLGHMTAAAALSSGEQGEGATIAIVQHPSGDPKKIASGTLLRRIGGWLFYDNVDTRGGSSGSGILNDTGQIIGVHTNGGCTPLSGGGGDPRIANRGVALQSILAVSDALATRQ